MSKYTKHIYPKVSVIIPCRNEKSYITSCVESIMNNNYPGEIEIIVVDGMSDDGTREVLEILETQYDCLKVLDNPSRITPVAMNIGLHSSEGDIIMIMGAHCEVGPKYILNNIQRLLSGRDIGCSGGRTTPRAKGNTLQRAIAAVLSSQFGVGNSYFRIPGSKVREVDTVAFGLYRREVFEKVGDFDERLVRNQDIEFNYRVRKAGYKILLDPTVEVYYNPRRSLLEFWRQNFGNGFWNIISWKLVPGSLSWRHFIPFFFITSLIILGITFTISSFCRILFMIEVGTYLIADALETMRIAFKERKPEFLLTFFVFPVLHVSYGLGSLCGIISLLRDKKDQ